MLHRLLLATGTVLVLVASPSCDLGDFDDLNDDPTRASEISPQFLFTRSLVYGTLRYDVYQRSQHLLGSMYAQYMANLVPNWPTDRYETGGPYDDWVTAFWQTSYASYGGIQFVGENVNNTAVNIEEVIRLTDGDPDFININAQARIWRVYLFHRVTDAWGDVPYSEALRGRDGERTPAYDPQEAIYRDMLATLDAAVRDLDAAVTSPGFRLGDADVLLADDLDAWARFGNALRLRLAMRTSEVAPDLARENAAAAIAAGLPESNLQSVRLLTGTAEGRFVNRNPLSIIAGFENDRVSETLVERLKALGDPRLFVYADSTLNRRDPVRMRGLPNGLDAAALSQVRRADYSRLGETLRADDWPVPVLTYPEVAFLQAEAALRGWTSERAGDHYERGVRASFEMYGLADSADAYLAQPGVAWDDGADDDAKRGAILTQKWIALFTQGLEAWADVRRTGSPQLAPVSLGGATGGAVPARLLYPREEFNVNTENVEAAAARIGGDRITTRVWWDPD